MSDASRLCGGSYERRSIDAPSSVLKEERRKQPNIATENNREEDSVRRVEAAGQSACEQQDEVES